MKVFIRFHQETFALCLDKSIDEEFICSQTHFLENYDTKHDDFSIILKFIRKVSKEKISKKMFLFLNTQQNITEIKYKILYKNCSLRCDYSYYKKSKNTKKLIAIEKLFFNIFPYLNEYKMELAVRQNGESYLPVVSKLKVGFNSKILTYYIFNIY